ncbi:MAG: hypothetical protein K0S47_4129 [Herbinix sp.]|nr:hypothetical protein [Herbinix sp.]
MNLCRKNKNILIGIMIMLMISFMIYSTYTHLNFFLYTNSNQGQANTFANRKDTLQYNVSYPNLTEVPEEESFSSFKIIEAISIYLSDSQRIFYGGITYITISVISLILAYVLLTYRRLEKHTSLLAISIGGHAPPTILLNL